MKVIKQCLRNELIALAQVFTACFTCIVAGKNVPTYLIKRSSLFFSEGIDLRPKALHA